MANIEKEFITYVIITRGTEAELGKNAQDPYLHGEPIAADQSDVAVRGFFWNMIGRVLNVLKITKLRGPDGPHMFSYT